MLISGYQGMESQSNQAPVRMTLTSTPVYSEAFIVINAANMEKTAPFLLISQQLSFGKYDFSRYAIHVEL